MCSIPALKICSGELLMLTRFWRSVLLSLVAMTAAMTAAAQQKPATVATPNLVTAEINEQVRTPLPGSVSPLVKKAADLGSLSGGKTLKRMVLVLKPTDAQQQKLESLLKAQQSKGSGQYHKWLTPAAFGAQFSPSAADVAKVAGWLQSRGFTGVTASASGQRIEFSGAVSTVETAFQTSMHSYQLKTAAGVETHVANASEISIPSALAPVVAGVLSLNDFQSKPMHVDFGKVQRNADGKLERVKGDTTFTDGNGNFAYYLAPGDIRKIYGASSLPSGVDGTGVSVAVIGRSDVQLTDIQTFRNIFQLPANDPNFIVSGPDPGMESYGDAGESTLDLEWVGSLAPKATINFVTAASTDTTDGISLAAVYAVENVTAPILTLSYGQCEQHLGPAGNLFWKLVWEQAAAEGISVFVSSGDGGAGMCDADDHNSPAVEGDSVSGLSSTPYNTAVGGTQFAEGAVPAQYWDSNDANDYTSALGYIPEAAWNESCDPTLPVAGANCAYGQTYYMSAGGGGGRSNCADGTVDGNGNVTCTAGYAKPSWQTGPGVPADGVRDVPDVSLNASSVDDPYMFCFLASCSYTVGSNGQYILNAASLAGGTSISTPVMAGIMTLIEQQNGAYQGLANPVLYQLAQSTNASCSSSGRTDPSQTPSCPFNDVTAGNNSVPGLPGYGTDTADFTAGSGYDLATGLGSVNVANLVSAWKNAAASTSTTTALTVSTTTAKHGTSIPVSVAVTAASGTPAGDIVLLTDKYGAGDQYTLASNGTWSGNVADLPGGTYTLTARYGGDGSMESSTSTGTSVTITPENSVASMSVNASNSMTGTLSPTTSSPYYGSTLYFKGQVVAASGQGVPTGTVNVLMDGTTNLGTTTLTPDGGFLLSSNDVTVGNHALTVQYVGDNSFNASTSAASPMSVGKGQSVTNISLIGGPNSYTAALVSYSGSTKATGTLQVYDNGVAISAAMPIQYTGPVGDGYAQIYFSHTYAPGPHVIQAVYSGDSNYLGVALNSDNAYQRNITVGGSSGTAATVTNFKMTSGTTLQMGQIATFTFSVTPKTANGKMPTGTVFIYGNNDLITSGNLVNGQGSGTFYADSATQYTITAQYQGDSTFAPSMSTNTTTLTVPKLTPAISFGASASYAAPGSQVSLNFTASGVMVNTYVEQDPNGTVTFTDAVNGGAPTALGTFNLNFINGMVGGYSGRFTLPVGNNVVTATYNGNPNFNVASSSTAVVVGNPDFLFASGASAVTVSAGSSGSTTLTLTPELGYTATVALACGSGIPAGSTCSITPNSLMLGTAQTATVTIATPAPSPAPTNSSAAVRIAGGVVLGGLMLIFMPSVRRRPIFWMLALVALVPLGCGGSGGPKNTLLSIASSNTKAAAGGDVTLTATLSALASNPTGTVTFYDGTTALGSPIALSQNTASLKVSNLSVGAHTITASYSGDKHNGTSTSIGITQVITGSTNVNITATAGSLTHTIVLPVAVQ
jgi:subtilase family serine protease